MGNRYSRQVNLDFDTSPSIHHKFNFYFSRKYLLHNKVLDIGCWSGLFEKISYKVTKQIVGLDPNNDAIREAKKIVPQAKFTIGNALKLPFKKETFNTVLLFDVIEHIPKNTESKCLSEIHRVLKKRGNLIISTPANNILSILLDPAFFILGHRHYSLTSLQHMLSANGFKIIKYKKVIGITMLLSYNIEMFCKHILKRKFTKPTWLDNMIKKEYYKGGFAEIYLVAQKIK